MTKEMAAAVDFGACRVGGSYCITACEITLSFVEEALVTNRTFLLQVHSVHTMKVWTRGKFKVTVKVDSKV